MSRLLRAIRWLLACAGLSFAAAIGAQTLGEAPSVVHMLDYIAVDYPGFVQGGKVLDEGEYEEQLEFARKSAAAIERLPDAQGKSQTLANANVLLQRIESKAAGGEVAALARSVAADVIRTWSVQVAPRQAPDLRRAAALYQAQCAACHGAQGRGDGLAGRGLDPKPSDFHDDARMRQRTLYGLYNTITLGVGGTAMRPFAELSEADRWALAFLAAGMRADPARVERGRAAWDAGIGRSQLADLKSLVTTTPEAAQQQGGAQLADAQAFLVAHPDRLQASPLRALQLAHEHVRRAVDAHARGQTAAARQHAIRAYLEGFELVERALDNVDRDLRLEIERRMMHFRVAIEAQGPNPELIPEAQRIGSLLERAQDKLGAGGLSETAAFASSLLIVVREGLEAILVLAAIVAFVRKSGRADAMPYIHAGWAAAVVLGLATWLASNYVLEITGASREVTEGVAALLAAAMLLYVGAWLHQRSHAQAWQQFVRGQVNSALGRRTLWALAGISFLAVYRELFEVVLFYQTLWAQAGPQGYRAVLGGMAAGAAALALLTWVILRVGVRLPLGVFFALTTGLLLLLAVVFVGHGVAALQEAGVLGVTPAAAISMPWLGVHPTLQGLAAQALVLAAIAAIGWGGRRRRPA